jgi:hypothetical protein
LDQDRQLTEHIIHAEFAQEAWWLGHIESTTLHPYHTFVATVHLL